ncbi:MFS transporter [Sphingomonas sp. MG17]|uniref:MFS transporter n=1 Tax=Sphingomonas tagetis TaxID=2949092 RepID=A0A9X2HJQ9_9SPHN|nr:MFS transporter [Sphingomonas tagetis]MCP3731357.1 MFS transporter [Sphingomonas tagetis]
MSNATINVTDLINDRPVSRYQFGVFFLCALAALMDGFDSVIIGITAPGIAASLGLDVKDFGPVFSAAQFGFMIAAFVAGPLADRFGRKSILTFSVVVFGLFALLTPLSGSFEHLIAFRFLTGLGLGGASVTFVSLSTEYAPLRIRATVVSIMWTMLPLGSVLGGFASSILLPSHGWMPVYYIGGAVPIAIALLMLFLVPESISFLAVSGARKASLARIVQRIAPDLHPDETTRFVVAEERTSGSSISNLFTDGRATTTLCLWGAFFCCWLVVVTLVAWVVPILKEAGIPLSQAPLMVSAYAGGTAIGAPIVGRIMDKYDRYYVLILFLLIAAVSVSVLGFAVTSVELFAIGTLISGIAVGGASSGLVALVAASYPVSIRSTGVGWAVGMSRFGGTVGPALAGLILASGWSLHAFFGLMGVALLVGTGFLVALMLHARGDAAAAGAEAA